MGLTKPETRKVAARLLSNDNKLGYRSSRGGSVGKGSLLEYVLKQKEIHPTKVCSERRYAVQHYVWALDITRQDVLPPDVMPHGIERNSVSHDIMPQSIMPHDVIIKQALCHMAYAARSCATLYY